MFGRRILIALALVLGACGDDGGGGETSATTTTSTTLVSTTTSSSTTSTTTTAPTTTTTVVLSRDEAASRYVELVTPSNCSTQRLQARFAERFLDGFYEEDWATYIAEIRPLQRAVQDSYVALVEQVVLTPWPSELQADFDAFVGEVTAWTGWFELAVNASSFAEYAALPPDPNTGSAATTIRAKLGLESNVGSGANRDSCNTA